ncbi:MAG: PQQ-binding-like beta-propeller repeat protein [Planctomycetes bacterium]|nr:PQQ-binding-like beta-propeller repeat protein [Planctomycetota bacterium]
MPQNPFRRLRVRISGTALGLGCLALTFFAAGCGPVFIPTGSLWGGGDDRLENDPNRRRDESSGDRSSDQDKTPGERRERDRISNLYAGDPTTRQPSSYYAAQLAELPLRMKYYDLTGPQRRQPVVIRELHIIHDDVRDEILVVDADKGQNHIWSIDAYDFTLHWKTVLEQRVNYDPLPTRNCIVFMNRDGQYQSYDRMSTPREGESRLVSMGRFEGDTFPSAPPASNDTHVFVPATNSNSMRGLPMNARGNGQGADSWAFPKVGQGVTEKFMQIAMQPAADRETVAFVNNNHYLYMVDAQSGEYRASPYLEAHSRTPPVIKDDLCFVGSDIGQLFAWQKSGEAAWVLTTDGIPYGKVFVEDNWVFVHTLELYDRDVVGDDGKTMVKRAATRPGKLCAYRYEVVDVPNDRPVYHLVDGDPKTPWNIDPIWSEPDVGQQVLMLHNNRAYVLYEEFEDFLTENEKARMKADGRIVRDEDALRTINRELRVLDLDTGRLERPEWNLNLADFAFVRGSMEERDRAIYLGTKDGYVFKAYGDKNRSAGGK